ncbi:MAG TPA: FtsW/RodA/SpoVE family cell cycle protein, partial [Thermoleophilia bacterium]|nr:FtsW/RodA/SpoVE family cell cycle protein [Thermoleophilia bacterium]
MDLRSYLRHFDYLLLLAAAGLLVFGVTMIYFATRHDAISSPMFYARSQIAYAAVGFVALLVLSLIDYEHYRRWQWPLYGFVLVSIAAVFVLGPVTRGSRRWIPLPFVHFQPSELALVILTVTLAAFLTDRLQYIGLARMTVLALAYVALPAALVFAQPDLGTAMVFLILTLTLLLFYGTPWSHFAALFAAAAALGVLVLKLLPMAGVRIVHSYQTQRLFVFLHPGHDLQGSGYNLTQSLIAVGSGALHGRGDQATQTVLDFLPEHHTDFIFAVIGERYGFVGAALLLALFAIVIWRALRIATISRDLYGSMIAGCIAAIFLFEVF